MYYFSFHQYAGYDRVFVSSDDVGKPGDLLVSGGMYLLCLGDDVAFIEKYSRSLTLGKETTILHKQFLSSKTLSLVHWMVYTWYTTYKKIVPLFLPGEPDKMLGWMKTGKQSASVSCLYEVQEGRVVASKKEKSGQQVFVFPDLWTMHMMVGEQVQADEGVVMLHSSMTDRQKTLARDGIKRGAVHTVCATHAEIFQDWNDLQYISFVAPQKWYFASQRDPRYKTQAVLEKMVEVYGAELKLS